MNVISFNRNLTQSLSLASRENIFLRNFSLCVLITLPPFSLVSILYSQDMDSVKDSAKPAGPNDRGEDTVMGTTDESKAQGPMVGPSK